MQKLPALHRVFLREYLLGEYDKYSDIDIDGSYSKQITLIYGSSSSNKCPDQERKKPDENRHKGILAVEFQVRLFLEHQVKACA